MREFFTIAIFKIKADIRMNKTTLNSQKEKHSTLSLRRATPRHRRCTAFRTYFYPRPPCGERLTNKRLDERERNFYPRSPCGERLRRVLELRQALGISIHALLTESDLVPLLTYRRVTFLSTLSLRRATGLCRAATSGWTISIHALLTESDVSNSQKSGTLTNFYPRSPYGERQNQRELLLRYQVFLSTLSLRRATRGDWRCAGLLDISIHALLTESDKCF